MLETAVPPTPFKPVKTGRHWRCRLATFLGLGRLGLICVTALQGYKACRMQRRDSGLTMVPPPAPPACLLQWVGRTLVTITGLGLIAAHGLTCAGVLTVDWSQVWARATRALEERWLG